MIPVITRDFGQKTTPSKAPATGSGADPISSLAACDDAVLIRMAIAGRHDCFSLLMDRHLTAVKKRVRVLVSNQADLDDVIQEVLLKAWRHLASFRAESNFRTWMMRIGINEALQLYRRDKHSRLWEPLSETIALREEPVDQRLLRTEAAAALHCAMAKLPPRYQEVLMIRDLWEIGGNEAAKRLQTAVPTMKSRLFRARHMLSKELRKPGALHSTNRAPSNRVPEDELSTPTQRAA